eukprot:gene18358-12184_t
MSSPVQGHFRRLPDTMLGLVPHADRWMWVHPKNARWMVRGHSDAVLAGGGESSSGSFLFSRGGRGRGAMYTLVFRRLLDDPPHQCSIPMPD